MGRQISATRENFLCPGPPNFLPLPKSPKIGGEIITVDGRLGLKTTYNNETVMSDWERVVVCTKLDVTMKWEDVCTCIRKVLHLGQS